MPISSSEIAAMNGGFMSQTMGQMQYASSIGQGAMYGGGGQGARADQMMGGMMNRAGSVGSPLMSGAMGLLGLDPMSLGLRAGMSAFGSGAGLGGAAMAGAGVALPAMAIGAAAHYAGSQAYTGAQQQQTMNNVLRQSFGHRGAGGQQGFDRGEMSSIGAMTREMSHQFGPGGEIASMGELTQLAGKMGQMGFAQGVRDVKEFGVRFKEMVKTLKTMATDLGTTLEGAMEFAGAAKQSGVFGMSRIQGFTGAVRGASVSGGLAVSEVTAAASIGSQISRSVGGLGRAGAMAGIKTISQIGTAVEMGALSEEDIYNATGQTGAEGRQAFGASQLQGTASFLKTGRGRRLLASIAGKDGKIDMSAVETIMNGGMGIPQTMQEAQKHLGQVGRANFIRNEGRLRGGAMEALGGFGRVIQMKDWAESKGLDINTMDDRSMLFMQRQLGMGRDEMDAAMKMVNNMPAIAERQRTSLQDDQYFKSLASSRKQRGVEGVQTRFNQAKETVNSKLQKVGQDIFNEGAEQIDLFMSKLTGTYVETFSRDADDAYRAMRGGGRGGAGAFGLGGVGLGGAAGALGRGRTFGGAGAPGTLTQMRMGSEQNMADALLGRGMPRGAQGAVEGALGITGIRYAAGAGQWLSQGQSDVSKLREAGFNFTGVTTDAQAQARLMQIQAMQRAAATGFNEDQVRMGASNGAWIRGVYLGLDKSVKGEDRMAAMEQRINAPGAPEALKAQLREAKTPDQKAALFANWDRGVGVTGAGSTVQQLSLPPSLRGLESGKFETKDERNLAYGGAMGVGGVTTGEKILAGTIAGTIRAGASLVTGGGAAALGLGGAIDRFSVGLAGRLTGTRTSQIATGEYLGSAEGREDMRGLLGADKAGAAETRAKLEKAILSDPDSVLNKGKRNLLDAADYNQAIVENNNKPLSPAEEAAWEKKTGRPAGSAKRAQQSLGAADLIVRASQDENVIHAAKKARAIAGREVDKLAGLGVYNATKGTLTDLKAAELDKLDRTGGARKIAEAAIGRAHIEMGMGGTAESVAADRAAFEQVSAKGREISSLLAGKSVAEQRAIAKAIGGDIGAEIGHTAALQERVQKLSDPRRRGPGSRAGAVAQILGVEGLSKEQLSKMDLAGEGATALLAGAGIDTRTVGGADLVKQIQEASAKGKGAGDLTKALKNIMDDPAVRDKKEAKDLAAAEAANPLQAAIKKNSDQANELLKKLVLYSGMTADEVKKLQGKDPESGTRHPGEQ